MSLSMLLLWFPIVLAVGAAGRLLGRGLGRGRGLGFGLLCALFWVVLVQATAGVPLWSDVWTIVSMVAGAAALAFVGAWSGQANSAVTRVTKKSLDASPSGVRAADRADRSFLSSLASAFGRFDEWLEDAWRSTDPWADFGEYLRSVLYDTFGATHVQPFRLVSEGGQLEPLRGVGVMGTKTRVAASEGLMGRVLATEIAYVAGAEACGREGDDESGSGSPTWCFAVTRGKDRLGVIAVGKVGVSPEAHPDAARAVERFVGQAWSAFVTELRARSASVTDATSTLATRDAFMRNANIALRESYALGEPVAVAVLATQGLRNLTDAGRWESADDVVHTVGDVMRRRVRLDDCLGRIDEGRVVWLLRRVDVGLAKLVVGQLASHVGESIRTCHAAADGVRVDCGVACSGHDEVPLRTLLVRALEAARRARLEKRIVFFDEGEVEGAGTSSGERAGRAV